MRVHGFSFYSLLRAFVRVFSRGILEDAKLELGSAILPETMLQEELPADASGGAVQENQAGGDAASEEIVEPPLPLSESNFDLLLYGGLTLLILGFPAALYKLFCTSGDSPSGLGKVVSMEREGGGGKMVGGAPARYNTEQLRQTVARLRAQV